MDNVQYSSDIDQLEIERSNYVPDGKNLNISGVTDMEDDEDEHSSAEQEATIPLQTLGVVNASGSDIQENGLLAHALANVSKDLKKGGYSIRGLLFVNEYPWTDEEGMNYEG
ncbi:hypothetical protein SERLADRAFT_442169 [Serpula lacrymans var. lacrymans S7.9]|uniref:Uncharacterized protein n=1 Tax=Serpula lacrymans var. lacrymans (strain S7.9) TaxID=578457 RepID=F8P8Q2_SERL9|nr:uncharacterized protein SERLADRAFT_442169 [Serpula lacrymans var. lacrymans S7.9]EGO20808.1 hypothetical protein SERLADRAFT_442169 [Serpula lacrymans var. lacrymans S7.9]